MGKLGGALIVRNGVSLDYCLIPAIESLLAVCDEVVVLDASSDDGTLSLLDMSYSEHPKVKLTFGHNWNCQPEGKQGYFRLSVLTNIAKKILSGDCDWHLVLQADEVLHEDSFHIIRAIVDGNEVGRYDSFTLRRYNLWGDFDHYIRFDINQAKPCSDIITRLARPEIEAYSDAESLQGKMPNRTYTDVMNIFHYGFVRKPDVMLDKIISMQSWFWPKKGGEGIQHVDKIVLKQKETTGLFDPLEFKTKEQLKELIMGHPVFAHEWVAERRQYYNIGG